MMKLPRHVLVALAVVSLLAAGCGQGPQGPTVSAGDDGSAASGASSPASEQSSTPSGEQSGQSQGNLQVDRRENVSVEQARDQVEFPVGAPPAVPPGWVSAGSQLVDYDADNDGVPDATHYIVSFRPKGADKTAHAGLSIRQATDTGRPDDFDALESTTLDDGTVAYLTDPPGDAPSGAVTWWRDGGYYTVSAHGLPLDRLVTIANRLNAHLDD